MALNVECQFYIGNVPIYKLRVNCIKKGLEKSIQLCTVKQLYSYCCNRSSLSDWLKSMEALLSWIRYSPMQPPLDMSGRWSSRCMLITAPI
jgi:hypothetical protein